MTHRLKPIRRGQPGGGRRAARWLALGLLASVPAGLGGCFAGELAGGMIESYRRSSTKTVPAEYTGLSGKSYAVVVSADRMIQADHPEVVARLTVDIAERLKDRVGATGYVPGQSVLAWQFNQPRWVTMTHEQVAKSLGVERLIVVELTEYRLNDPGNEYVWQGVAAGTVAVVEVDGDYPEEFAFQKALRLRFPDKDGFGPADLPRAAVNTELTRRFVDRATWLFFDHEEKYYPDY
jgi:hypothetical protein